MNEHKGKFSLQNVPWQSFLLPFSRQHMHASRVPIFNARFKLRIMQLDVRKYEIYLTSEQSEQVRYPVQHEK